MINFWSVLSKVGNGYIQCAFVTAETKDKIYDVVINPDGQVSYQLNSQAVAALPQSSLVVRKVLKAAEAHKEAIVAYLNMPDGREKTVAWHSLTELIQGN